MAAALRTLVLTFGVPAALFLGTGASAAEPTAAPMPAVVASAAPEPSPTGTPNAAEAPAVSGPKITWSSVHVNGPYIAMTFDDGPSAKLTPELLDILAQRHMHVTFFVVGENAQKYPAILKRAVAEGHEIGNHSWSHPNLAKMSDDAVRSELDRTKAAIVAAIGTAPTLMRPPYGSLTNAQRRWVHDDLGYTIILWSVDPDDWKRPGPAIVEQRILEGARNGSIILSHDIHPGTVEAMPSTFDTLLGKGFKFVTVSELIAMDQPMPSPSPGSKTHPAHPKPTPNKDIPEKITGAPGN